MSRAKKDYKEPVDYIVKYRYKSTDYIISVKYTEDIDRNIRGIYINGEKVTEDILKLVDDKRESIVKVVV